MSWHKDDWANAGKSANDAVGTVWAWCMAHKTIAASLACIVGGLIVGFAIKR